MLIQAATVVQTPANVYHQVLPLLTKKINAAEPTDAQKSLLNASAAFLEHGTNHSMINSEIIQAIASVDFFTDILPQYIQPNTASGTIQAALLAAQMSDDVNILNHRQSIIKSLLENTETLEQLSQSLNKAKTGEDSLLSSFSFNETQLELINGMKVSAQEKLYFTSDIFKLLNNKYILDLFKRIKTSNLIMLPTVFYLLLQIKFQDGASFTDMLKGCNSENFNRLVEQIKEHPKEFAGLFGGIGAFFVLNYVLVKPDIKQDFDLIYDQQKQLINVAKLIHEIKQINDIIDTNESLRSLFSKEHKKLNSLFNSSSKETSDNLKYVISELQSSSFKGDPSYYLSLQGKILATHYYLQECKAELIPFLEAFGTIDAYVSTAKLYQKFENHPHVKFCLPEFVDNTTPVLDITNYWHPLIDPNVVVTNSLHMGNDIKNLMITGPNAGGKTTSLMSLIINIIFAQSFGIAPSEKIVMTPFAKIHSYLDITTNLQEGLSLFAAEVDRAKKLKNSILSCTENQKTFTIIDEIFSGTAPDVAADVGSKFATQLGDMKHSMTIITTHFKELTKVGQDTGTFTNYKVADATIMPDGKIVYPFKLVPGISSQNIAQHMLEQQNII